MKRSDEEGKGAPPNLLGGHFFDNHEEDTDSSEDERPSRNTSMRVWCRACSRDSITVSLLNTSLLCCLAVGDVPLKWYKHEDHIGYDREGEKISKKVSNRDRLDDHLAKQVY